MLSQVSRAAKCVARQHCDASWDDLPFELQRLIVTSAARYARDRNAVIAIEEAEYSHLQYNLIRRPAEEVRHRPWALDSSFAVTADNEPFGSQTAASNACCASAGRANINRVPYMLCNTIHIIVAVRFICQPAVGSH